MIDTTKITNFMSTLNEDELYLFQADMEDAIDGVIEDWDGK